MRTCNRANRRESTIELLSAPAAGGQYGTLRREWGERAAQKCVYVYLYLYCLLRFNSQQNKTIEMLLEFGSVNTLICKTLILH